MKFFAKNNAGSFLRNKESHLEVTMHRRKENKPRTSPPPSNNSLAVQIGTLLFRMLRRLCTKRALASQQVQILNSSLVFTIIPRVSLLGEDSSNSQIVIKHLIISTGGQKKLLNQSYKCISQKVKCFYNNSLVL